MNVAVEKQDAEIDGLPIRYRTAGEGPPAVPLRNAGALQGANLAKGGS